MGTKFLSLFFRLPRLALTMVQHLKEREFVSEAICNLISNKCLEVLDHPPAIVNPLSVSTQSSGKKRLILDLRHVNLYIFKHKFKCEDLSVALKVRPVTRILCGGVLTRPKRTQLRKCIFYRLIRLFRKVAIHEKL